MAKKTLTDKELLNIIFGDSEQIDFSKYQLFFTTPTTESYPENYKEFATIRAKANILQQLLKDHPTVLDSLFEVTEKKDKTKVTTFIKLKWNIKN